ncbi:MAG: hypothetical protein KDE58_29880, partial [Caldilineaceae bacterium]|nr:hypothetical protein [Caldilineaceae bacterium]
MELIVSSRGVRSVFQPAEVRRFLVLIVHGAGGCVNSLCSAGVRFALGASFLLAGGGLSNPPPAAGFDNPTGA